MNTFARNSAPFSMVTRVMRPPDISTVSARCWKKTVTPASFSQSAKTCWATCGSKYQVMSSP